MNRDAIGAWVEMEQQTATGPVVQRHRVMPARSYQRQVEPVVMIGSDDMASADDLTRVEVLWPDGARLPCRSGSLDQMVEVNYASVRDRAARAE